MCMFISSCSGSSRMPAPVCLLQGAVNSRRLNWQHDGMSHARLIESCTTEAYWAVAAEGAAQTAT